MPSWRPDSRRAVHPLVVRPATVLLALALGVLPTLVIDFFHTERHGGRSESCPACQLHQAATAVGVGPVDVLPDLVLAPALPPALSLRVAEALPVERPSRAPPA